MTHATQTHTPRTPKTLPAGRPADPLRGQATAMLHEMAYVLHLTRKVKQAIIASNTPAALAAN